MIRIGSKGEYTNLKAKASSGLGFVAHFSAGWCEPCKAVSELLGKEAKLYGDSIVFVEVDGEAHSDICEMEGVESVPYIAFWRTVSSGELQERVADVAGAKTDVIIQNLRSLYGEVSAASQRAAYDSLDGYLKYLTNRPGVVLFITGTPSRPRCGFTGRLCEMMYELNVNFVYYDVMASDEVCEGLKRYANWPTYPQVYVDGELVGGLDVCKQLLEEGELRSTLKLPALSPTP